MLSKKFKISSFLPPTIFTIGGETYVCPGWHKVPKDITLIEVRERWTKELPKTEKKPTYIIHEIIDSSTGNGKTYDVRFDGIRWTCTCPGFEFRQNCRHLKEVKMKHNIKEVQYK